MTLQSPVHLPLVPVDPPIILSLDSSTRTPLLWLAMFLEPEPFVPIKLFLMTLSTDSSPEIWIPLPVLPEIRLQSPVQEPLIVNEPPMVFLDEFKMCMPLPPFPEATSPVASTPI